MKIIKIENEKYDTTRYYLVLSMKKLTLSNKKQYIRATVMMYENIFYFPTNSREQVSNYLYKQLTTAYKEYIKNENN